MLKVQDGCRNYCAYCIIPYARGPVRSLPLADAVEQARRLADEGYRELVITGIEISSWGVDFRDGSGLSDLLTAVCAAVPEVRVRLGSLEPRTVTEAFCRALSPYGNLCPQFHLSLQSGCDAVLRRMNRRYDTARYLESAALLRRHWPGCALTTDLIVGFPGGDRGGVPGDAGLPARLRLCPGARVPVLPPGRHAGPPSWTARCPADVKAERAARAGAVAAELADGYRRSMVRMVCRVLFEQPEDGVFTGHAENYVKVYAPGEELQNRVLPVEITGVRPGGVTGRIQTQR